MIFVKFIVLILLGAIMISLFAGLFFLVKDKGQTKRTVNALTVRIGLSLVAIVVILIAAATGVIEFNSNPLRADAPGTGALSNAAPDNAASDNNNQSSGD